MENEIRKQNKSTLQLTQEKPLRVFVTDVNVLCLDLAPIKNL